MKCTSCGEQVLSTEKFCKNCGKAIEQKKVCSSCGESVLSTEKFCKNCGKPIEQKNESNVVVENPNKRFVLTFEALDQSAKNVWNTIDTFGLNAKAVYSIEVDGEFIGKIKPTEKIETFVTKGKHDIILKRNKAIPNDFEVLVEDNQTVFLFSMFFLYTAEMVNPSDTEKEEMLQYTNKINRKINKIIIGVAIVLSALLLLFPIIDMI